MLNKIKSLDNPTTKFSKLKIGHLYIQQRDNKDLNNSDGLLLFMGKVIQKKRYSDEQKSGYLFLDFGSYKIYARKDNLSVIKKDLFEYAKEQMEKEESWCSYVEYEIANRYSQLRNSHSVIAGEIESITFTENEVQELIDYNGYFLKK